MVCCAAPPQERLTIILAQVQALPLAAALGPTYSARNTLASMLGFIATAMGWNMGVQGSTTCAALGAAAAGFVVDREARALLAGTVPFEYRNTGAPPPPPPSPPAALRRPLAAFLLSFCSPSRRAVAGAPTGGRGALWACRRLWSA